MGKVVKLEFSADTGKRAPAVEIDLRGGDVSGEGSFLVLTYGEGVKEFIPASSISKALVYEEEDGES